MTTVMFQRCLWRNINFIHRRHIFQKKYLQINEFQIKYHTYLKNQIVQKPRYIKLFSTKETGINTNDKIEHDAQEKNKEVKLGLFQRFKQMYRDYWYVLVPVHVITSCGWFGAFYYTAKSGVNVVDLLHSLGFSETFTNPLKDSSMGYIAISYAMYKIATPLRYTVTLGGTTISINYLRQWGYIKPVPSKDKLKEMYIEKKAHLRETIQETREELRQRKDQLKERKNNIIGDYTKFKKELKDIKHK